MNSTQLLPWPADAVMIVAAPAGTERREWMEAVVPGKCRHCGQAIHADVATIRVAENAPWRLGRPIEFFCVPCHNLYDLKQFNVMVDHRGGVRRPARVHGMSADLTRRIDG